MSTAGVVGELNQASQLSSICEAIRLFDRRRLLRQRLSNQRFIAILRQPLYTNTR